MVRHHVLVFGNRLYVDSTSHPYGELFSLACIVFEMCCKKVENGPGKGRFFLEGGRLQFEGHLATGAWCSRSKKQGNATVLICIGSCKFEDHQPYSQGS